MKQICLIILFAITIEGISQQKANIMNNEAKSITCKLTTTELQERKATVIAEVKRLVVQRTETENGIEYGFNDSDKIIDLLMDFIKTERLCCDFFTFTLTVGDESLVLLELSGPPGTKEFIEAEIGF